jgi:NADPH:quinone reductase-like Zn-dependent oxidoreductase
VLIHGAAGAVGVFAVQLARRAGAHVVATASAPHAEFLRGIGAAEVIDYHTRRFEDHAGRPDVIFDCVGGETLDRSWGVLAPGGRLVTIGAGSEAAEDERTKRAFFIVVPDRAHLREIAALLEAGELRVFVDAVVPLAEAASAYLRTLARPTGRGKVVVSIDG